MNFKKSFAMCLSMLVSLIPSSTQAMKECPDEKDMLLPNSSNSSKLNNKDDEDTVECIICLEPLNSNNEQNELEQAPNCHHKFHKSCLSKWKKYKNACPLCRQSFLQEGGAVGRNILDNINSEQDWREHFERIGAKDIHDFPEMQGKSDDEIIEFLVKPLRDGTYDDIHFFFFSNSPFERQIFYYPDTPHRAPEYGIPLRLQTAEGLKAAGIANRDFGWRVWRAAFEIRAARRRAAINASMLDFVRNQHRVPPFRRFCESCGPTLFAILPTVGLGLLAYYYA